MSRRTSAGAAALALLLAGCGGLAAATEDRTALRGDIPVGLGRRLDVTIEDPQPVADVAPTSTRSTWLLAALLAAFRSELEARDLFDRVEAAPAGPRNGARNARLLARVTERRGEAVFDAFELSSAWVERIELEVELRDESGRGVLAGHITGVGVDAVTDPEQLDPDDVAVAALHDAAMKLSRALGLVADRRAKKALETLPTVRLPAGTGPLQVAILGFEDEASTRLPRGPALAEHLQAALEKLGPDVGVLPPEDVERALREGNLRSQRASLDSDQVAALARLVPSRVFISGRVVQVAGQVEVTARVQDRDGRPVGGELQGNLRVEQSGLGALRVAAVELARALGEAVLAAPPLPN